MSGEKYKDEGWLREKYHSENLSQSDIAELCSVDQTNILYWMDKFSIETRDYSEAVTIARSGKFSDEEWLRNEYKDKTIEEISDEFGYSTSTIKKYLSKYGIETRGAHRRVGKYRGTDNPQWKGGEQSWRKTVKWQEVREQARNRDNFTCQRCGRESDNLHVHHITPVGEGGRKYDMDNLKTLCPGCHYDKHR